MNNPYYEKLCEIQGEIVKLKDFTTIFDKVSSGGSCIERYIKKIRQYADIERVSKGKYIIKEVYEDIRPIQRKKSKPYSNRGIKRKDNIYDFCDGYIIGYTKQGDEFYFDTEDYDKVSKYFWTTNQFGYIIATTSRVEGKTKNILLHRLIMSPPQDLVVDHINRQRNDCRKSNLRICTHAQNMQNTDRRGKGYYAPITCLGYTIDGYEELGVFTTRAEAIEAYQNINKEQGN